MNELLTLIVALIGGLIGMLLMFKAGQLYGYHKGYNDGRKSYGEYLEQRHDYTPSVTDVRMNHYVNVLNQAIRRTNEDEQ